MPTKLDCRRRPLRHREAGWSSTTASATPHRAASTVWAWPCSNWRTRRSVFFAGIPGSSAPTRNTSATAMSTTWSSPAATPSPPMATPSASITERPTAPSPSPAPACERFWLGSTPTAATIADALKHSEDPPLAGAVRDWMPSSSVEPCFHHSAADLSSLLCLRAGTRLPRAMTHHRSARCAGGPPGEEGRSRAFLAVFVDFHHQLHVIPSLFAGRFRFFIFQNASRKVIGLADEVRGVALGIGLVDRRSALDSRR